MFSEFFHCLVIIGRQIDIKIIKSKLRNQNNFNKIFIRLDSKMKKILLLSLLAVYSLGLRSTTDPTPKYYSPSVYEKNLNEVQTRFEHEIDQLKSQLGEVETIINDANKTTGVKIVSLSQKMAEQRNSLYNIQQYLQLPFEFKACECRELSENDTKRIKQKSTDINNNISSLQKQIAACSGENCQENQYLAQQLKNMKVYMSTVDSIINSDCCHQKYKFKQQKLGGIVDMSNYLYKDNLKSGDWFYGNITEQDYKLKMFELSTKYNVTNCPLAKPFANVKFNRCQKCDQEGAIFDLGSRSCFFCGKLGYLNTSNSKCEDCPTNQVYNFTKKACQACSPDHYLNTSTQACQLCPVDQHYSSQSNQCQKCPQNSEYDRVNRICKPCNNNAAQFFNPQIKKCQSCSSGLMYNTTSLKCQSCENNSYYDKKAAACTPCGSNLVLNPITFQCQACPPNTYFYEKLKKCATCPPGYKYDSVTQHCVNTNPPTPTPNPNPNPTPNNTNVTTQCPASTPVYNEQLKKCEACPPGMEYNPYQNNCLKHIGICPKATPYFNITQNKCVACPSSTTYNELTYLCEGGSKAHTHVQYL